MDIYRLAEHIGETIKSNNLTITEVADRAYIKYNVLYRFLNHSVENPKLDLVMNLFDALHYNSETSGYLLGLKQDTMHPFKKSFLSDENNLTIDSLLKEKMNMVNLKNKDLADIFKVTPSYLSKALKITETTSLQFIVKLAVVLDISYPELKWVYSNLDEYPHNYEEDIEINPNAEYRDCCKKTNLENLFTHLRGKSKLFKYVSISYEEENKTYVLVSDFCSIEVGGLLKKFIEDYYRPKGYGKMTLLNEIKFPSESTYENGYRGYIVNTSGDYAYQIENSSKIDDFPLLYCSLINMESLEKKEKRF